MMHSLVQFKNTAFVGLGAGITFPSPSATCQTVLLIAASGAAITGLIPSPRWNVSAPESGGWRVVRLLVVAVACGALVQLLAWNVLRLAQPGSGLREISISIGFWAALATLSIFAARTCVGATLRALGIDCPEDRAVSIIGHGAYFDRLGALSASSDGLTGIRIVDMIALPTGGSPTDERTREPYTSEMERLAQLAESGEVNEVWIVLPLSDETTLVHCCEALKDNLVTVRLLPDIGELTPEEMHYPRDLAALPSIELGKQAPSQKTFIDKEIFDRAFATAALVALLPVLVAIAASVKLSSSGPVFFKQRRKGLNGRPFTIYKFRTMRVHTEKDGVLRQATRNDARITRVGRFLRRTSLDELPQFINVFRGEMSVVGPRPHALEHDALYGPLIGGYASRYRIKPGITGWAQVNGFRGETDKLEKMAARIAYDLHYLKHRSFWLDMKIVLETIRRGFIHRHAY
jgi:putative colanic acid biosysnthesis UDP-glucose lipid carrier transferase